MAKLSFREYLKRHPLKLHTTALRTTQRRLISRLFVYQTFLANHTWPKPNVWPHQFPKRPNFPPLPKKT